MANPNLLALSEKKTNTKRAPVVGLFVVMMESVFTLTLAEGHLHTVVLLVHPTQSQTQ